MLVTDVFRQRIRGCDTFKLWLAEVFAERGERHEGIDIVGIDVALRGIDVAMSEFRKPHANEFYDQAGHLNSVAG